MKVFSAEQIRAWDAYTIENEPVASVSLMDRAARAFTRWFSEIYPDTGRPVWVFAGPGNNGGDGLAVAGLLHRQFYPVKVFVCAFGGKRSADFDAQLAGLPPHDALPLHWMNPGEPPPQAPAGAVLIDALFGTGLTRPLDGPWAPLIEWLNGLPNERVAIDLPSGLLSDAPTTGPCLRATRTFSFEQPKRAFFFAENADRVGEWTVGSIGLHPDYAARTDTPFHYLTAEMVQSLLRPRPRFSHKGACGHALLINGSFGKIGAAVLAARACLRAGAGLLTVHTPRCGYAILQGQAPEAMCSVDAGEQFWTVLPDNLDRYSAVGAGCGTGQDRQTAQALKRLLQRVEAPLVLDADALNILAKHPAWFGFLPKGAILTPHPKEFERLFGKTANSFARNDLQRAKAREHNIFIVLKGAFTAIACPDGSCWFNPTGNPGMATGGSGDVLTGVLTGLLAQGYPPREACLLGVWLHGLAGDLAAAERSQPGLTAGDIAEGLGKAWLKMSDKP